MDKQDLKLLSCDGKRPRVDNEMTPGATTHHPKNVDPEARRRVMDVPAQMHPRFNTLIVRSLVGSRWRRAFTFRAIRCRERFDASGIFRGTSAAAPTFQLSVMSSSTLLESQTARICTSPSWLRGGASTRT